MKKIKDAHVEFTIRFNYTESVNEMIKDGEVVTLDNIRDILAEWAYEDLNSNSSNAIPRVLVNYKEI